MGPTRIAERLSWMYDIPHDQIKKEMKDTGIVITREIALCGTSIFINAALTRRLWRVAVERQVGIANWLPFEQ